MSERWHITLSAEDWSVVLLALRTRIDWCAEQIADHGGSSSYFPDQLKLAQQAYDSVNENTKVEA